jgi:hypothetical protein
MVNETANLIPIVIALAAGIPDPFHIEETTARFISPLRLNPI